MVFSLSPPLAVVTSHDVLCDSAWLYRSLTCVRFMTRTLSPTLSSFSLSPTKKFLSLNRTPLLFLAIVHSNSGFLRSYPHHFSVLLTSLHFTHILLPPHLSLPSWIFTITSSLSLSLLVIHHNQTNDQPVTDLYLYVAQGRLSQITDKNLRSSVVEWFPCSHSPPIR